jgi:hypothetical protein
MATDNKLSPNFAWLFALVTLGVTIGVNYLIPHVVHHPLTPKALAGVYFAIFGGGATLAMLFTESGALRVVGTFAAAALGLGIFYYAVIAKVMAAIASGMGASSGGASSFGRSAGLMFAVFFAFEALAASIAGALFGKKLRNGLGGVAALRRT